MNEAARIRGAFISGVMSGLIIAAFAFLISSPQTSNASVDQGPPQRTDDGIRHVRQVSNGALTGYQDSYMKAVERCYKGVTYAIFLASDQRSNVGSVVLTPDGKPIPCDP